MPYTTEAIYAATRIKDSLSFKAVEGVRNYLDTLSQGSDRASIEKAANFIYNHFIAGITERAHGNDNYTGVYDYEALGLFDPHTDEGKKILDAMERQILRAFIFGYMGGVEDRDRLPVAREGDTHYATT